MNEENVKRMFEEIAKIIGEREGVKITVAVKPATKAA